MTVVLYAPFSFQILESLRKVECLDVTCLVFGRNEPVNLREFNVNLE